MSAHPPRRRTPGGAAIRVMEMHACGAEAHAGSNDSLQALVDVLLGFPNLRLRSRRRSAMCDVLEIGREYHALQGLVRGGSRQRLREQRRNRTLLSTPTWLRCNASSERRRHRRLSRCRTRSVTTPTPMLPRQPRRCAGSPCQYPPAARRVLTAPLGGQRAQRRGGSFNPPAARRVLTAPLGGAASAASVGQFPTRPARRRVLTAPLGGSERSERGAVSS